MSEGEAYKEGEDTNTGGEEGQEQAHGLVLKADEEDVVEEEITAANIPIYNLENVADVFSPDTKTYEGFDNLLLLPTETALSVLPLKISKSPWVKIAYTILTLGLYLCLRTYSRDVGIVTNERFIFYSVIHNCGKKKGYRQHSYPHRNLTSGMTRFQKKKWSCCEICFCCPCHYAACCVPTKTGQIFLAYADPPTNQLANLGGIDNIPWLPGQSVDFVTHIGSAKQINDFLDPMMDQLEGGFLSTEGGKNLQRGDSSTITESVPYIDKEIILGTTETIISALKMIPFSIIFDCLKYALRLLKRQLKYCKTIIYIPIFFIVIWFLPLVVLLYALKKFIVLKCPTKCGGEREYAFHTDRRLVRVDISKKNGTQTQEFAVLARAHSMSMFDQVNPMPFFCPNVTEVSFNGMDMSFRGEGRSFYDSLCKYQQDTSVKLNLPDISLEALKATFPDEFDASRVELEEGEKIYAATQLMKAPTWLLWVFVVFTLGIGLIPLWIMRRKIRIGYLLVTSKRLYIVSQSYFIGTFSVGYYSESVYHSDITSLDTAAYGTKAFLTIYTKRNTFTTKSNEYVYHVLSYLLNEKRTPTAAW